MSNTIKATNRTIEISSIDSDYEMDQKLNVQSVVLIPGIYLKDYTVVDIIEINADSPVKLRLTSTIGTVEPRCWLLNQRLQLGFIYDDCTFNTGAKVIFNLRAEVRKEDAIYPNMKMKLKPEDAVL